MDGFFVTTYHSFDLNETVTFYIPFDPDLFICKGG